MASAQCEETNWQTTRESIRERNKYMFNNSLLSDVKFVMRNTSKDEAKEKCTERVTIPAHKYVLAISSPVFFAMFYGDLAETTDTIELSDCDSEGFLELLRYMYCDEAELTGSNVMQVLYLANKFIIPSLVTKCTEFLEQNLDATNVLAVLNEAKRFSEARLVSQCWLVVDEQASEVVKSQPFATLDRELLSEVVERDSLVVTEVDLFQAVNRWAVEECQRRGLEGNGKEKREVLGPVLELIRFPLMTMKEFAGIVLLTKLLDLDEVSDMFRFYNSLPAIDGLKFRTKPRRTFQVLQCKRFGTIDGGWSYANGKPDAITVSVNIPVVLMGFRLIGSQNSQYSANMKLFEVTGSSEAVVWSREETYTATTLDGCSYCGYDVMFESGISLRANTSYTIEVTIQGRNSERGQEGLSFVHQENLQFSFTYSSRSSNSTNVSYGQFPVLFFCRLGI